MGLRSSQKLSCRLHSVRYQLFDINFDRTVQYNGYGNRLYNITFARSNFGWNQRMPWDCKSCSQKPATLLATRLTVSRIPCFQWKLGIRVLSQIKHRERVVYLTTFLDRHNAHMCRIHTKVSTINFHHSTMSTKTITSSDTNIIGVDQSRRNICLYLVQLAWYAV